MMHIGKDDLYDRVEAIISAADFIEISVEAQVVFSDHLISVLGRLARERDCLRIRGGRIRSP